MAEAIALSGSLRGMVIEDALVRARAAAGDIGVTRVTELTRLDTLGVPVCVAIRPRALAGSLCVSAGKGWTLPEARVGALMEAVEHAWVEPGRSLVPTVRACVREFLDGATRRDAILDLCPRRGATIDLDAPTLGVRAEVLGGGEALVPAELVFHPAPSYLGVGLFGTGTNSVAAGCNLDEATLHALVEACERDALSFHHVRDATIPIATDTLPEPFATFVANLPPEIELFVRAVPNALDLPCFTAVLYDTAHPELSIRGDGLHFGRAMALSRAITEAAQCRATIIHGGRDDLDHFVLRYAGRDEAARAELNRTLRARMAAGTPRQFTEVVDVDPGLDLAAILAHLRARLAERGFADVLRVVLTPPEHPVQVVRAIVPRLECFIADSPRLGRRLRDHVGRS